MLRPDLLASVVCRLEHQLLDSENVIGGLQAELEQRDAEIKRLREQLGEDAPPASPVEAPHD